MPERYININELRIGDCFTWSEAYLSEMRFNSRHCFKMVVQISEERVIYLNGANEIDYFTVPATMSSMVYQIPVNIFDKVCAFVG